MRTALDPSSLTAAVANAIHEVDPEVALLNVRTMDDLVSASLSPQRFTVLLLAAFAGLALLLAAVGIYSVISYSVSRRTHEIGIRTALGSAQGEILRLVLKQGAKLALVGVALGTLAALALTRLMQGLLYGVSATDAATFVAVAVFLIAVALPGVLHPSAAGDADRSRSDTKVRVEGRTWTSRGPISHATEDSGFLIYGAAIVIASACTNDRSFPLEAGGAGS